MDDLEPMAGRLRVADQAMEWMRERKILLPGVSRAPG
jgi:hypothetical protein